MQLGQTAWAQSHGATALTLAIVMGMLLGNTVYPSVGRACGPGVNFSKARLLRLGVVLYGWRLTVQDIGHVGVAGVVVDALVLCSTLGLAYLAGTRWLRLDRDTSLLIGTGSAICGAAAVMAAAPVVRARSEQVTVAIATVVVFGTLSIFLYPVLYSLNQTWHLIPGGAEGFGIYAGSTIHEVAQVVAAARSISPAAADTAVIAKMVRVMMLAPALIALSSLLVRRHAAPTPEGQQRRAVAVPWFAFAFIGVVLLNSLHGAPGGDCRDQRLRHRSAGHGHGRSGPVDPRQRHPQCGRAPPAAGCVAVRLAGGRRRADQPVCNGTAGLSGLPLIQRKPPGPAA